MIRVLRKLFSGRVVLYLFGMAAIYVGERLVGGSGAARFVVDAFGIALLAGSVGVQAYGLSRADERGRRRGHRTCLVLTLVGAASLLLYLVSLEPTGEMLGLGGDALEQWRGAWGAVWPALWFVATLPLITVDRALYQSPVVVPAPRIDQALNDGLAVALGLAMLFPINFIAQNHSRSWSLAYFETARPGSATQSVVENADEPVHVFGFFPPASGVASEVSPYFEQLEGSNLKYRQVDQTANPELSRRLRVRQNGVVVFTNRPAEAEAEDRVVEKLQLGVKLEETEEELEELDQKAQKRLLAVSSGERVVYLTRGHGEFTTDNSAPRDRRLKGFEKTLEAMNFEVETLGVDELAEGVPDRANVVAIVGPRTPFLKSEVDNLISFARTGGSLLVAVEPGFSRNRSSPLQEDDPLVDLLDHLGVGIGSGVLASENSIIPMAQNKSDRVNVVTDQFSSHPSTATLSDSSMVLFTPTAGPLELEEGTDADVTSTVNSRHDTWVDLDTNLEFDGDGEENKTARPVVAASTGGGGDGWRALVSADATLYADLAIGNRGNQQFVYDGFNWLLGTSGLTGSVDSEEDVRIRHTKEDQAVWFWGTIVAVPLLILVAGVFRVWRRQQGGDR